MVKGLKDENAPKKPLSAYFTWQNSCREKVKASMPNATFGEMAAKFSEKWKALGVKEKSKFETEAKAAQEKYAKLMAKYKLTPEYAAFQKLKDQSKVDAVKKQKFKKDENAPSKALSAYFLFVADKREGLVNGGGGIASGLLSMVGLGGGGGMSHKDAVKKLGEMWSGMSASEKKPYEDKAAAAKAKYEKELAKYHQTAAYKKYQAAKEEFDTNKKAELKQLKDKQKKKEKAEAKKK